MVQKRFKFPEGTVELYAEKARARMPPVPLEPERDAAIAAALVVAALAAADSVLWPKNQCQDSATTQRCRCASDAVCESNAARGCSVPAAAAAEGHLQKNPTKPGGLASVQRQ